MAVICSRNCCRSCRRMLHGRTGEIIVVDNGSHDGTPEFLDDRAPTVRLHSSRTPGFAKAVNTGIRWLLFPCAALNNDMEPHESFLPASTRHSGLYPTCSARPRRSSFPMAADARKRERL